ncbi:MAG TPA: methyltransferase domain-containing protein [Dehalococcoidia bacterium]|nr:methyltransferase domain-containing protein [Dehalococcoidia bacterium]
MTGPSPDAATLGEPSYVWRPGQERRLELIRAYVGLEGRRLLDVGCGVGTYVRRLREFSSEVYGVDVSPGRLQAGSREVPGLLAAVGEHLPIRAASIDMVLLNEVIEHVQDDRRTLEECVRVLRPGGHAVIFAPNRLYPFETHGVQLGARYVFGNIPLVNYLPDGLRNRVVPHARAYRTSELRRLTVGLGTRVLVHGYVYPGFDNIAARSALAARFLRAALYRAEHTRLRRFGLSHFLILEKLAQATVEPGCSA